MSKVAGPQDATAQLNWFKDLCNDTWQCRDGITPCYERRRRLGPLDVYRLLPRPTGGDCGEATCIAFAFRLLLGEVALGSSPRLREEAFVQGGSRLAELLGAQPTGDTSISCLDRAVKGSKPLVSLPLCIAIWSNASSQLAPLFDPQGIPKPGTMLPYRSAVATHREVPMIPAGAGRRPQAISAYDLARLTDLAVTVLEKSRRGTYGTANAMPLSF
jgi:hypothetical protein